jgi:hypothetical protein
VEKGFPSPITSPCDLKEAPELVSDIHTVHKAIIMVNEIRDIQFLLPFLPKHFRSFVASSAFYRLLSPSPYITSTLMDCGHKEDKYSIFPGELEDFSAFRKAAI